MKQTAFRLGVGMALAVAAVAAQADIVTATPDSNFINLLPGTSGSLSLSKLGLGLINVSQTRVVPGADGVTVDSSLKPGSSTQLDAVSINGLSLQSVMFESSNGQVLQEQFGGAFKFTTPAGIFSEQGGAVTLSDLRIDFTTGTVYASLMGDHGVGLQQNLALWTSTALGQSQSVIGGLLVGAPGGLFGLPPAQAYLNMANIVTTVSDLSFTTQGAALWASSMGYSPLGNAALSATTSLGSISTAPVPETSTLGMMWLGLAGMALVARRAGTSRP